MLKGYAIRFAVVTLFATSLIGCGAQQKSVGNDNNTPSGNDDIRAPLPRKNSLDEVRLAVYEMMKAYRSASDLLNRPTFIPPGHSCIALQLRPKGAVFMYGIFNCALEFVAPDVTGQTVQSITTGNEQFMTLPNGHAESLARLQMVETRLTKPAVTAAAVTVTRKVTVAPNSTASTVSVDFLETVQDRSSGLAALSENWTITSNGAWGYDGRNLSVESGTLFTIHYRPHSTGSTPSAEDVITITPTTEITFQNGCPYPIGTFKWDIRVPAGGTDKQGTTTASANGTYGDPGVATVLNPWPSGNCLENAD